MIESLTDGQIVAFRDLCRTFISESRLALGEVTSSPDSNTARERAKDARDRCVLLVNTIASGIANVAGPG